MKEQVWNLDCLEPRVNGREILGVTHITFYTRLYCRILKTFCIYELKVKLFMNALKYIQERDFFISMSTGKWPNSSVSTNQAHSGRYTQNTTNERCYMATATEVSSIMEVQSWFIRSNQSAFLSEKAGKGSKVRYRSSATMVAQ